MHPTETHATLKLTRRLRRLRTSEALRSMATKTGAVVAELVRAHGGTIETESEPGRGTTFVVGLPRS